MRIKKILLGRTETGIDIFLFELSAGSIKARVMTYGAVLMGLYVPDRDSAAGDVTLGYDSLKEYMNDRFYFGSIVGRFANRIKNGTFSIDNIEYQLTRNVGENHLHGGENGFNKKVWLANSFSTNKEIGVALTCESLDGEEGYPGKVWCEVKYSVTSDNSLIIRYTAESTRPTPINLAHHSYFNLNNSNSDILDHRLTIFADAFLPVNGNVLPTGDIAPVNGTPFDFRGGKRIGEHIDEIDGGYDNTFVLQNKDGGLVKAAKLWCPDTGRVMEMFTTKPGIHLYSGNYLDSSVTGKKGIPLKKYGGLCLEDQHFPDSPNIQHFPNTILMPGHIYEHKTVYSFSVK
ncbi:galactose mutarotase [bacterium]|nr:galactose mutarotase [bacterium]